MSLSRGKPLEADREHDWGLLAFASGRMDSYRCQRCGEVTSVQPGEPPPDWKNCPGMKRGGSLERSKGLSPVSETNSGREHQKDEAYRDFVRDLPCTVCGKPPPSDPHHVKTWGSGFGDWLPDGTGNLTSLCREHHDELDSPGSGPETMQDKYDVDLAEAARQTGEVFREQGT